MAELESFGSAQTLKTHMRHGAQLPAFGVKVGDMKKLVKKIKKDYQLSKELYATGNSDAMYFAGLIADEKLMTKEDFNNWISQAYWSMLAECTVAWVATESPHGLDLAAEWIESDNDLIASAGWCTLTSYLSITPDEKLDLDYYRNLLHRVSKTIHNQGNRTRYSMNGFVIGCGCFVTDLQKDAKAAAKKIGKVDVFMGETACKVPEAVSYIEKVDKMGRLGAKKKQARC